jgi:hypothetical protein
VTIHIPLFISRLPDSLKQGLCLSVYAMFIGTVAAMGSGSGGRGVGGAVQSTALRQEVGAEAFKFYNQCVALMRAQNYATAQIKFEQAIRANLKRFRSQCLSQSLLPKTDESLQDWRSVYRRWPGAAGR